MLLRSAHLTAVQQTQVRQIMSSQTAASRSLMQQLRGVDDQISAKLLSPGPLTDADLAPLEQQAMSVRQHMAQGTLDASLAIRNVLTADQLHRLAEVHEKLGELRAQIESLVGPGPGGLEMLMAPPH